MAGIAEFLKLGRKPRLDLHARHQLLMQAIERHEAGIRATEIEAELVGAGCTEAEARRICDEARPFAEAAVMKDIKLPRTSRMPVNYYFALGLTPRASLDRVRMAYRERAREIHPDRHAKEVAGDVWTRMMTVVGDAEQVLGDAEKRRAYDLLWLRRSRDVTRDHATPRERRGDWDTRHLWYMAELSEMEDRIASQLKHVMELLEVGGLLDPALFDLRADVEEYESRILSVRTQAQATPQAFAALAARVRQETQRKDRLLAELIRGIDFLPEGAYSATQRADAMGWVAECGQRLAEAHQAHRAFEVEQLRAGLAAAA